MNVPDTPSAILKTPKWLSHSGTALLWLVAAIALFAVFLFPAWGGTTATAKITAAQSPTPLMSPSTGVLLSLPAPDGTAVSIGDVVAVVGVPGDEQRWRAARDAIAQYHAPVSGRDPLAVDRPIQPSSLPDSVAPAFTRLLKARLDGLQSAREHAHQLNIQELALEQAAAHALLESSSRQASVDDRLAKLARDSYARRRQLVADGWLSPAALEEQERESLSVESERLSRAGQTIDARRRVKMVERQLEELVENRRIATQAQAISEAIALSEFRMQLSEWEAAHVVRAQGGGRVSYYEHIRLGEPIETGSELGLISVGKPSYGATAYVPAVMADALYIGQPAVVTLASSSRLPTRRLRGAVSRISPYYKEGAIQVDIVLPQTASWLKQGAPGTVRFQGNRTLADQARGLLAGRQ